MYRIPLEDQLDKIIESEAIKFVEQVEAEMRANAPVYTGKLISTIRTERVKKWKWIIAPDTDYDYYAEYGNHANNRDGYIHPTHGRKAMKWVDNQGRVHFATKVKPHEGSKFVKKTASKYI